MNARTVVYVGAMRRGVSYEVTEDQLTADQLLTVSAYFFKAGVKKTREEMSARAGCNPVGDTE